MAGMAERETGGRVASIMKGGEEGDIGIRIST
jgi:hypothetical protein